VNTQTKINPLNYCGIGIFAIQASKRKIVTLVVKHFAKKKQFKKRDTLRETTV